tara:strand:- start:50 stop:232 length:183 start_codon:yes stop_codon:yes gene_type:complete
MNNIDMNHITQMLENSKELGRINGIVHNLQLYETQLPKNIRDYFRNELDRILKSVDNIKL